MPKFAIVLLLSAVCCSAGPINGPLASDNILNWNLTVTDPTQSVTSFQIIGPSDSQVGLAGSDLTETSTELLFNFSGTDNGYLLFQSPTLLTGTDFWCSAASASPNGCSDNPSAGESLATNGPTEDSPVLTGEVAIGTGGTVSGVDMIYNVDQQWKVGSHTFTVTGTITTGPPLPAISSPGGVVNGASFQPGISPGSWITISGTSLSSIKDTWDNSIVNGALPTTLDAVSVSVGGQPAYVQYISPTQINALAPDVPPGTVAVTVTNSNGASQSVNAQLSAETPAFFQWGTYAVATHQDFTYAVKNGTFSGTTTIPAAPGDVIILWGTGFGPTSPAAPAGVETPSTATYNTANTVSVTVGDKTATVYGAALASGYAGLYQIAIQIPASLANGDYPVVATINGVQSPATTLITVQQ
jgi:uncharacterized protein (TIGR03437 family)